MVAAVSAKTPNPKISSHAVNKPQINGRNPTNGQQNPKRPPLLPSGAENGPADQLRRPKSREVTSRYLSSSSTSSSSSISTSSSSNSSNSISSRRSASPMVSRTVPMTPVVQNSARRAQSAERRRPVTPRGAAVDMEMSSAAKALLTSKRSLSVSFQGESFSRSLSKAKPAPSPAPSQSANGLSTVRRGTPERRKATPVKDRLENSSSKPSDQQRWPGRSKPMSSSFLTRSLDYGAISAKTGFSGSVSAVKSLQKSLIADNVRPKAETKMVPDKNNFEAEKKVEPVSEVNSAVLTSDTAPSDSDSVSSGSTSGSLPQARGVPRGIVVPARFWQETNNRVRRVSEPGSPASKTNGAKITSVSKFPPAKMFSKDSFISSPRGLSSPIRGASSPIRGATRPASPSKSLTPSINSSFRGAPSPGRTRNGVTSMLSNDVCSTPSILNFAADIRRGKVGENKIVDAHELRLLHNRQLQWRFVNARAESTSRVQTEIAERTLFNAWVATTKLRQSVISKRLELQLLSQNLRLFSILKEQVPFLDDWDMIEGDHANALSGAIEALEASTVRLPVVGGARADIRDVKNAMGSAVDVMQSMGSSICSLLQKVEEVSTSMSELASLTTNERAMISQCKDMLSNITAMEVSVTHTQAGKWADLDYLRLVFNSY
ncbi:OLC1v1016961C1 [Oldenlandia corymbosa var. corymbosa]|uniref:OLC1v1016961C1 n=1 Tax=Oldenlandia corymbosa var. corymbosa TaxID=529605 RepID=A0AAV1E8H3_OLDCO|nr:OLC1v1016961C1 [Oldenlandia corymbosa var. corymbosa]